MENKIKEYEENLDKISNEMTLHNDKAEKLFELFKEKEALEELLLEAYESLENLQN